jgi:hypothetical protein
VVTPSTLALAAWGSHGHRSSDCQGIWVHFLDSTSCALRILQLLMSRGKSIIQAALPNLPWILGPASVRWTVLGRRQM